MTKYLITKQGSRFVILEHDIESGQAKVRNPKGGIEFWKATDEGFRAAAIWARRYGKTFATEEAAASLCTTYERACHLDA